MQLKVSVEDHYRVLAKCEGGGELAFVHDEDDLEPWRVPCDGETHRQKVVDEPVDVTVGVKSSAGGRWVLVVGHEEKPPQKRRRANTGS